MLRMIIKLRKQLDHLNLEKVQIQKTNILVKIPPSRGKFQNFNKVPI